MKVLMITGDTPYNRTLIAALCACNIDVRCFGAWHMYLPDYMDEILALTPDIVSLQWPEALCEHNTHETAEILADFARCLPVFKQHGIRVMWTMHNLLPHLRERMDLWTPLFQLFADHADGVSHHSQWGMNRARSTYTYAPHAQHFLLRHGYFTDDHVCPLSQLEARAQLGIDADALLFFAAGHMRPDKKIIELVQAFLKPNHHEKQHDVLLLAGSFQQEYLAKVRALTNHAPHIHVIDAWLEAADMSLYARAADAFIFFYGAHHLTSGSPHLSQAFLLPQITLDTPYNREVMGDAATYIPQGDAHSAALQQIRATIDRPTLQRQRQTLQATRDDWQWSRIATLTVTAYHALLTPTP